MYTPAHFQPPDEESVARLLGSAGSADLITMTEQGLMATLLPLNYLPPDDHRRHGTLIGHVARNNDQWRLSPIGEAMAIVRGEDAYISPSWYATKAEHGRVVPTWNYVTAHVHGRLIVHDDTAWVASVVRALTGKHEAPRDTPWSVDDAPARYIEGQLRAIVGVEMVISRIEAKYKLSQNRSADDIDGVVQGLAGQGRNAFAAQTKQASTDKLRAASGADPARSHMSGPKE